MIDALEAIINATIGLAVSWLLTWLVLGYAPAAAAGVTAMFFFASFTRSWVIRAAFRRWA